MIDCPSLEAHFFVAFLISPCKLHFSCCSLTDTLAWLLLFIISQHVYRIAEHENVTTIIGNYHTFRGYIRSEKTFCCIIFTLIRWPSVSFSFRQWGESGIEDWKMPTKWLLRQEEKFIVKKEAANPYHSIIAFISSSSSSRCVSWGTAILIVVLNVIIIAIIDWLDVQQNGQRCR